MQSKWLLFQALATFLKTFSKSYQLAGAHNGGIYQVANVKYNHVKMRNTRYFGTLGITSQMARSN